MVIILGYISRALISEIVKDWYSKIKNKISDKKSTFQYEWVPEDSIKNRSKSIKDIDKYPKDVLFDFEKGDLVLRDGDFPWVAGLDCFKMHIIKLMNTEKEKYIIYQDSGYGISYLFQNVTNEDDFNKYSMANSEDMINEFSEWIREVFYIKKYRDKNCLQIGLGLKGRHEIVRIDVDLIETDRESKLILV